MAYEGKRSAGTKKKGKVTLILIIVVLVAALAAGAIWYFAGGATQAPEKIKNDQQETIIPEDDVITTDYMELAYPGMWTDRVEHQVTQEVAQAFADADGGEEAMPLYLVSAKEGTNCRESFMDILSAVMKKRNSKKKV